MTFFAMYPEDFEPYDRNYLLDRAESLYNKKKVSVLPNLDFQKLNKKTYIHNINVIADKLERSVEDIRKYFSIELRAAASIKEDGSMKIDKLFHLSNLNPVYKSFIRSIQCDGCKSIRTFETKEDRILFIECRDCHRKVAKE